MRVLISALLMFLLCLTSSLYFLFVNASTVETSTATGDVFCTGDFYFYANSDGTVDSHFPASNVICDVIYGSLKIYGYNELYEQYIPQSIKSIKIVYGNLELGFMKEYPSFLNTIETIGSFWLYMNHFNGNRWSLGRIKSILRELDIFKCKKVNISFPNLIGLGEFHLTSSSTSNLDFPKVTECGSLSFYRSSNLTSLIGFRNVKKINGYLDLTQSSLLYFGMSSLSSISGSLYISYMTGSFNFTFPNDVEIGDNLEIHDNSMDIKFNTSHGSTIKMKSLGVYYNSGLVDLSGLGKVIIGDTIYISGNGGRIIMFDTSEMKHFNGTLEILENINWTYSSFASLESIGGSFYIPSEITQDESLAKYYPKLKSVAETLSVYNCNYLKNLNCLNAWFGGIRKNI